MIEIGGLRLYDIQETAALLGVHHRTVRKMLKDGELVGRRLGKKWYLAEETLAGYFDFTDAPEIRPRKAPELYDRKVGITDIEQVDGTLPEQEEGGDGS